MARKIALASHYLDSFGGGVTQVVRDLEKNLSGFLEVKVFGLHGSKFNRSLANRIAFHRYGLDFQLANRISAWQPDLIHLHGMFTFVSYSALVSSRCVGVPLVVSPHGMLDSWALSNSPLKKRIFLSLLENRVLEYASRVHALNSAEREAFLKVNEMDSKVRIIPNGINCPTAIIKELSGKRFELLYLGRLHLKKGVAELLQGLYTLKRNRPDLLGNLEVNLVGWGDDSYVAQMKSLARSLGLTDFVHFRGAAFDEEKARYFASADAFILPSFSEGLPMAVLEAWSYSLPVLMTPECNLSEGFERKAAIQVQTSPESLANSIAAMLDTPRDELRAMGQSGLELVRSKFSWDSVAKQYLGMYDEVLAEHESKKLSKLRV